LNQGKLLDIVEKPLERGLAFKKFQKKYSIRILNIKRIFSLKIQIVP